MYLHTVYSLVMFCQLRQLILNLFLRDLRKTSYSRRIANCMNPCVTFKGGGEPEAGSTQNMSQKSKGVAAGSKGGGSRELDGWEPEASIPSVTPPLF
jgi:hypothetical protein